MHKIIRFIRQCRGVVSKLQNRIFGRKKFYKYLSRPEKVNAGVVVIVHEAKLGGAPLLGLYMAKSYIEMGLSVDIISLKYGDMIPQFAEICPVQVCVSRREMEKIVSVLRGCNYKIAICNGVAVSQIVPYLKQEGIKVISLVHELPGVIHYLRTEKELRLLCRIADKIVFPASYVLNEIEKEFGKVSVPVEIYHQGLFAKPEVFITKENARVELKKLYNIDICGKLYINVATINERKGFDLFVQMADLEPDSIFLWVGDGADSLFGGSILKKRSSEHDNLVLLDYISDKRIMTIIYAAATALLLTSREEPFGSVVLEAFANRTPVVAFDHCGGYIDVVRPEFTGDLAEPYNINDMLEKANRLFANTTHYNEVINNCYKLAMKSDFSQYCKKVIGE